MSQSNVCNVRRRKVEWRKGVSTLSPAQEQQMKALGEQLRQRRKEMNLSLKEAENATSIRLPYLQALEEGEMNKLISPVYAQGFFKQYASFLGMDGEQMIRENGPLLRAMKRKNLLMESAHLKSGEIQEPASNGSLMPCGWWALCSLLPVHGILPIS